MDFRILGPLEAVAAGRTIRLNAAKPRALLALLLLHRNEPVASDLLVEELWAGNPPATAAKTLQTYVSQLRKLLGDERIRTTPAGYEIRTGPDELDLDRFERLRGEGQLREALGVWRGMLLADFRYEPWAQAERARVEELRLEVLEQRIDEDLALGRHAGLAAELEMLIADNPLRERLRAQLMLALYRSGRQAEALEVFRQARAKLVEELGIEPGSELQTLNRAILAQDPALDVASLPKPDASSDRGVVATHGSATSFVGRKRELQEIRALLGEADVRLVTLTGAGGAGKTRLAFAVSGEFGRRLRHGAVVVDLAPISDPALVVTTVAHSLGLRETPGRRAVDALAAHFAGRETLLVLDNFEQVLPAASDVSELLERVPVLKVLVTSRAPLRVPQERVYAVPPLEVPDMARHLPVDRLRRVEAVRLFIERAQRSRADFQLSDVNAEAVAELCVRLDGLPLALELAAARIKMLSSQAIVDRLGRRLDLLRTEASDVPDRHRTMRSAIEWSYELLGEDEQRLLTSLGVFTGGFTLDGAEAVAEADSFDVLDGVESLLEGSLLSGAGTVADEPRFRMLETIRDFAAERLAKRPDANDVRRRHASFYLALAETAEPELRGSRQVAWLARVDADLGNLRAALAWTTETKDVEGGLRAAAALWRFCQVRGLLAEGREWLERPLALEAENVPPHARATALAAAGRLAFMQGDYEAARRYLEESVPAHRRLGDLLWAAQALGVLGLIARALSDDAEAFRLIEQSVELARSSRDWWVQSQALGCLGDLQLARGMPGKARLALEEALRASREAGDLRGIGRMLPSLGLLALAERDYELARLRFEEGLVVQSEVGDTWNISRSLGYLGVLARDSGDRAGARRLFGEAVAMQAETDDRPGIATSLELFAELAVADGRPRRAARLTSAAQILREDVGEFPLLPFAPEKPDAEALRAALGAEAFEEAWAKGRSMMLNEVITYALKDEEGGADLELVRRAGGGS